MQTVLVLKSSARGPESVSNGLIAELLLRFRAEWPGLEVIERDLDREPIAHLVSRTLAGVGRGGPVTPAGRRVQALSDALIAELKRADLIVIGAPMYNFGIASTLKSWFDHVIRAGATFTYSEGGPAGLVGPTPVIVIETRGGGYSEGPMAAYDAQEPHLRALLGLMGLNDVEFIRVEGLALGDAAPIIAKASRRLATVPLPPVRKLP